MPDLIAIGPVQVVVRKMFFQVVYIFHLFLPVLVIETDPLVYVGCMYKQWCMKYVFSKRCFIFFLISFFSVLQNIGKIEKYESSEKT